MFSLFTRNTSGYRNNIKLLYPSWRIVNVNMLRIINNCVYYQRSCNTRMITNNNPLYKIIASHCPSIFLSDMQFYTELYNSVKPYKVGEFYKFTTFSYKGSNFQDIVYNNSNEIFVVNEDELDFSYMDSDDSWRSIQPLKIVYLDNTTIDYCAVPNKKNLNGTVIFELDIYKMLFQYKKWANFRMANERSIDAAVYLYQYLIPNTILDYTNLTILNRLMDIIELGEVEDKPSKDLYPFYYTNLTGNVDRILKEYVKDFSNRRTYIGDLFSTIPILSLDNSEKTMLDYLKLNISESSVAMRWVPIVARARVIANVIRLLGIEGLKYNKNQLRGVEELYKSLRTRDIVIPNFLDDFLIADVKENLDFIKKSLNENINLKLT